MTRRRAVARALRRLALAGLMTTGLTICGVLAGAPAQAFEPPPGSKNFTAPSSAPNYFSNEAAPFSRGSRMAQPGADRFRTAPIAASGSQGAMAQPTRSTAVSAKRGSPRSKLARGRSGRGKISASRTVRAQVRNARGKTVLARRHAKTASRNRVAAKHRAAASRSRHAARGAKHAGRVLR
ncbi:MAG: hypothetical protein AB7H90_07925 [Alphaproteobacteria bacterium]